jgi:nucleotide-binding universal stress UspA family protein
MQPVVTVGLDGSPESLAAARWGADEADRRGLTLRLLHAWILLSPDTTGVLSREDQNYWARRIVHDAHTELRKRHPTLSIAEDLVAEEAGPALLEAASQAQMVVLGSRGLASVQSFFLGDISMDVASRAERPVVLVRTGTDGDEAPSPHGGGVVVVALSLDGPCDGLLEFAFDAAAARGLPLRAVHGRSLPVQAYMPWGVDPDVAEEIAQDVREKLSETLRPWREKHPGVQVIDVVRPESPTRAAVRDTQGADLLVVGRRRHRTALAPRLGPVAHSAVHHAACPLAVVPHD